MVTNMDNHQRKLLVVPILHTKQDMGSLGNHLSMTDGYTAMVSDFWREVREAVMQYINGITRVKVYQDGLPDTQEKLVDKIINEVKSPNYELLRWLKTQGAKVVGTENPRLIKEEYDFLKAIFETKNEVEKIKAQRRYLKKADVLLSLRDTYIAEKIDKTLKKGELGILFLGAAHKIESILPVDIKRVDFDYENTN